MCSAVTVECCVLVPVLHGCVWYVLLLCKEECSSPVSAITKRRDMGLYEVPLSGVFVGIGTMLVNFPCVRYYVYVKSSFKHTREECSSPVRLYRSTSMICHL